MMRASEPRLAGFTPQPEALTRAYCAAGYYTDQTLPEVIRHWAAHTPDAQAVADAARALSYRELAQAIDQRAAYLAQWGLRPRAAVLLHMDNGVELAVTLLALLELGSLPILALPAHRRRELVHFARQAQAVMYIGAPRISEAELAETVQSLREQAPSLAHILCDRATPYADGRLGSWPPPAASARTRGSPLDVALFQLSGGSTGLPKLIARTHADYLYSARASAALCGITPADRYLVVLPAPHNFPLSSPGMLGAFCVGASVCFASGPSPEQAFAAIARYRVTVTAVVPALLQVWQRALHTTGAAALQSLRLLQVGGAPLQEELAYAVEALLPGRLQQVYGMAEGLVNFTRPDDPPEIRLRTQGRPLSPADELRVIDREGNSLPIGSVGELITRGPYTLRGYYRAPEANARAFTPEGFYRTGDLVRLGADGNLRVLGRVNELINRGGEKFTPAEIEGYLLRHPAVKQAAVIGVADAFVGQKALAFIVPAHPDLDPQTVLRFVRGLGIASFKLPERICIVASLPLTSAGKVDKRALAAAAGVASGTTP